MDHSFICGRYRLDLSNPIVMGILNVTPDSFSDGGQHQFLDVAVEYALQMQDEGAGIIDIGGESTRPGAAEVSVQEELDRVIPVIEQLQGQLTVPISIDSSKPEVMTQAIAAGASMVNDVMALKQDNSIDVLATLDESIAICLMHMQGKPRTMQKAPQYHDVVLDVMAFLKNRVSKCLTAGIAEHRLLIDPGFGFGKTLQHNLSLLSHLNEFTQLQLPIMVGLSRKSMLGTLLNEASIDDRLFASISAAVMAFERGAKVIRVHDVKASVDALKIAQAVMTSAD